MIKSKLNLYSHLCGTMHMSSLCTYTDTIYQFTRDRWMHSTCYLLTGRAIWGAHWKEKKKSKRKELDGENPKLRNKKPPAAFVGNEISCSSSQTHQHCPESWLQLPPQPAWHWCHQHTVLLLSRLCGAVAGGHSRGIYLATSGELPDVYPVGVQILVGGRSVTLQGRL